MDLKKKELHIILQKSLDNASEKRNLVLNNPKLLKAKIDLKTFQKTNLLILNFLAKMGCF